jgi:hypothetical protein
VKSQLVSVDCIHPIFFLSSRQSAFKKKTFVIVAVSLDKKSKKIHKLDFATILFFPLGEKKYTLLFFWVVKQEQRLVCVL